MVVGVLEGNEAITVVRSMLGATNGVAAAPGTIRGDFSISKQNNLIHGSDSPESADPRDRPLVPARRGRRVLDRRRRVGLRRCLSRLGNPHDRASSETLVPEPLLRLAARLEHALRGDMLGLLRQSDGRPQGPATSGSPPNERSEALAAWFDRNGPTALGAEFIAMFVFGLLAMATDHWFPTKPVRKVPGPD